MVEEQPQGARVRLFVALDIPDSKRRAIEAWGLVACEDEALRRVPERSLHITLAFLGSQGEGVIERVAGLMAQVPGAAPTVELRDPVTRPPSGRARIVALPVVSPGTEMLQAALEKRLVTERLYGPGKRSFWPHVTVARVRSEGRGSKRPMPISRYPKPLPTDLSKPFRGVRMTLYRSELQPSGARYVPLAQVELPGAGRQ